MNPTLRQMRAFVAVAKTGNFTLAAQHMHVTQSALSGLIKELEQTLGARVVDRRLGVEDGDAVLERLESDAEVDLLVGITACSAEKSNNGECTPIDYRVESDRGARTG